MKLYNHTKKKAHASIPHMRKKNCHVSMHILYMP